MYPGTKIYYYLKSVGVVVTEDQIRIRDMFISDSEDWLWVTIIYNRHPKITKSEFIVKRWKEFTLYVSKNKELYFKYIKHVNKN